MGGQKPKPFRGEYEVLVLATAGEGDFTLRAWWPTRHAASRLTTAGRELRPAQNLASKKTVLASEQDRPAVARRGRREAIPKPN